MSMLSNAAETAILKLLFENVNWANIGDATGLRGSSAAGSFWIAIFTADPTDAGSIANECAYTSYVRVEVNRGTGEWTVTDDEVVNDNPVTFPAATGGSETATHWAICTASSGANIILHGELDASLAIASGITPQVPAGGIALRAA